VKVRIGLVALLVGSIGLAGCASDGPPHPAVCALVGAAVGAPAGAAADNPWHGKDRSPELYRGGAIGAAVGATAGALGCYLLAQGPKQAPQARASATPSRGTAPLSTELRGVGSDADGTVVDYAWDFGDGSKGKGERVTHVYQRPGAYTATLTVTDDDGLTGQASVPITAGEVAREPARIVLRGVNFDFDSARIRPDAAAILDAAAEALKENSGVQVEVAGHTDSIGTDEYNQGLSERRAQAVVDALVERGIDASRLSARGSGESQPVASNETSDGRAQNRRVELTQP
jgi:OOP family OmpA-OmpF porin